MPSQHPYNAEITREGLVLAEVTEVDHRIRERFQHVMQLADVFEPQEQSFEFVFPREHALNCSELFFEDIQRAWASSFRVCFR